MSRKTDRMPCHRCSHFYVTWDNSFPYGCKAHGFKGKIMPYLTVFQASGQRCLAFEPKDKQPPAE